MTDNASTPAKKRPYAKRQPQFPVEGQADTSENEQPQTPPAPAAPIPAVLALQEDVVTLVRQRAAVRQQVEQAQSVLFQAQANFQLAQSKMSGIESEVSYLHSQIAQLEGRTAPPPQQPFIVPQGGQSLANYSSEPTNPNDLVNRGHATRAVI